VEAIVAAIAAGAREGDTVALLSNGAFGGIYEKLRGALGGADLRGAAPPEAAG
jgi:UDP-N-acetylmuramate: L-alanyl-gamma-D-glutamyl-meso-diaminopimelate ligase